MKLIRKNVFETNSSSCHSLSVGSGDVYEGFTPNADNLIVIPAMEFGWEEETYYDVESRLAYVWIYMRDYAKERTEFLEMFQNVVCSHTGAACVTMEEGSDSWCNGYIDHQSVEDHDLDFLFDNEETLKNFLFGSGSSITTDNDNH